jgi:hypothetical protein
MPSLWDDVRFDPHASDELATQLAHTAIAVEEAAAVLGADGGSMGHDWIGPTRAAFDDALPEVLAAARVVADQLLRAAAAAVAATAAAEGEQQLRHRLRNEATLGATCAVGQAC